MTGRLTRRTMLAAGVGGTTALFAPAIIRSAAAAEFSFKLAHNLATTHPLHIQVAAAAERIKTESGGRAEIQIFPNSQLGSDTDTLSQLRAGAVDFFGLSGVILSILTPTSSINGVAFAFPDYATVWQAMDGDLGAYIRAQMEKVGLFGFEKVWDNGFRQITSSTRPITSPTDLKGFKIRVPVSPLWTSLFKAFEASPASINLNEVYSALQTKLVEGQENPLGIISTSKFYEVQKFCSLTNHMWDGYWMLGNKRVWDGIPQDLRAIITKNINMGAVAQRDDVFKLNTRLQSELASQGLTFNTTDPAPFRDTLRKAGFYTEWKGKFGEQAWALLEKSVGKL